MQRLLWLMSAGLAMGAAVGAESTSAEVPPGQAAPAQAAPAQAAPVPTNRPTPEQALAAMRVAPGFEVSLVAAEPDVRQPVAISFDGRGRLWVLQYLQYPTPAGLTAVSRDQYLRTVWDKVPPPPPTGPKGADKLTILELDQPSGKFKPVRDFVTGLNLASGFCLGHGPRQKLGADLVPGVYVAQPPYLLFYADANRDDVPDGDPVVILSGWGMEDSHAFPNSLQWGPDGWLYGAVGSTVTNKIRDQEFQQGVWRYDPRSDKFELFSEGGGNTWGLDFDAWGNVIAGTNWGGKAMLHQFPGAYYVKGFGKHGPLHNPHAYGYFDHVPVEGFVGGHVTCGGIVYNGGAFPPDWAGRYIAGNLLSHAVYAYDMRRVSASFTAKHAGALLETDDPWFRPIDCLVGPDGAVYVADWCDPRATHLDPRDTWHRDSGRIYRIAPKGLPIYQPASVDALATETLVELLGHRNHWWRREALRVLDQDQRKVTWQIQTLKPRPRTWLGALFRSRKSQRASEPADAWAQWALPAELRAGAAIAKMYEVGSVEVGSVDEAVRLVLVRQLYNHVSTEPSADFLRRVEQEPSLAVRAQLAANAKRMSAEPGLRLIAALLTRDADADDPHLPMLIWWAIEAHAIAAPEAVLGLLNKPADWQRPMMRRHLLERIARRYAAEGGDLGWGYAAKLLISAPDAASAAIVRAGIEQALAGRILPEPPIGWSESGLLDKLPPGDAAAVRFALRLGHAPAFDAALSLLSDAKASAAERASLIPVLAETGRAELPPVLLGLLDRGTPTAVRAAALAGLARFAEPTVAERVLAEWPTLPANLRPQAVTMLAARPAWAGKLLDAVDAGTVKPTEVSLDAVRAIQDATPALKPRLEKHWGRVGRATPGELAARASYLQHVVLARSRGKGSAVAGKAHFARHCAGCHQLWGEGTKIGPDLTGANRRDTGWLVANIVDPNSVVRAEYAAWMVRTTDERVLTGLLVEQTASSVTLLDAKNVRTVLPRADIDDLKPAALSLMPEKVIDGLSDAEVVDLFAFLQGEASPAAAAPAPAPAPVPAARPAPEKLRVLLVSGSLEYESDKTLTALQAHLEKHYPVSCRRAFRKSDTDLPGLVEGLADCDVMLLFTRRLRPAPEQLDAVKKYLAAGGPVVAVRTASHAFQNYLELDREILGGNYKGHFGAKGPAVELTLTEAGRAHAISKGFEPFKSAGSLYKNTGLAADVTVLMMGATPEGREPVAWTRERAGLARNGRAFTTSLGHQKDFDEPAFVSLLARGLFWAAGRDAPEPTK